MDKGWGPPTLHDWQMDKGWGPPNPSRLERASKWTRVGAPQINPLCNQNPHFATRIPTLQPQTLFSVSESPTLQPANRENAHFATRLLRVFVRLSACLRCYDFAISSRAEVEGCCGLYATSSVYNNIWGSSIGFNIYVSAFETMSTLVRNESVHEARC